jgi:nitrite reductase (NO-forming)
LGGGAIAASLVLLGALLTGVRRHAVVDRFNPAIDGYLAAIASALVGASLGALMVGGQGGEPLLAAHLSLNLFGFVGVVIASTLPYMTATQLRARMSSRATASVLRAVTAVLVGSSAGAAVALATDHQIVGAASLVLYAAAVIATVAVCPRPTRRNLRWAGPRAGFLALGVAWWVGSCLVLAARVAAGLGPSTTVVAALVIGGYAQILSGSLAYLAPVLRGGGHERLSAGFRLTRAWPALVAANVTAVGLAAGRPVVAVAGAAVWLGDAFARGALLARPTRTEARS